MTREGLPPVCYIYDFRDALSECEAELMVMESTIQVVLEIVCVEKELQFKIHSDLIQKWFNGDMQSGWETKFTRNKCLNLKD